MSGHVLASRVFIAAVLLAGAWFAFSGTARVVPSHVLQCDAEFGLDSFARDTYRNAVLAVVPDWWIFEDIRAITAPDDLYSCRACVGLAPRAAETIEPTTYWHPVSTLPGMFAMADVVRPARYSYLASGPIDIDLPSSPLDPVERMRSSLWHITYASAVLEKWHCTSRFEVHWSSLQRMRNGLDWLVWTLPIAWDTARLVVLLLLVVSAAAIVVDADRRPMAQKNEWTRRWWWTGELCIDLYWTPASFGIPVRTYISLPFVQRLDDFLSWFGLLSTGWSHNAQPAPEARRQYRRRMALVRKWRSAGGLDGELAQRMNRMVAWLDGDHARPNHVAPGHFFCAACVAAGETFNCTHNSDNWTRMPERAAMEGVFAARTRFNWQRTPDTPANRDAVFSYLRNFFTGKGMSPQQCQASIYLAAGVYWIVSDPEGELYRRFTGMEELYSDNRVAPADPRI